jgi:hypothetical protein
MGKPAPASSCDSEWLTTQEVMDQLLSIKRLRRFAWTCVLPAVRRDGVWKFRRADLDAWIRDRSRNDGHERLGRDDGTQGSCSES